LWGTQRGALGETHACRAAAALHASVSPEGEREAGGEWCLGRRVCVRRVGLLSRILRCPWYPRKRDREARDTSRWSEREREGDGGTLREEEMEGRRERVSKRRLGERERERERDGRDGRGAEVGRAEKDRRRDEEIGNQRDALTRYTR
jgi:hypothetical protein